MMLMKELLQKDGSCVNDYILYLKQEERCVSTIKQYERDIRRFLEHIKNKIAEEEELAKHHVIDYKQFLKENYQPSTVNVILTALNGFFSYMGQSQLRVKQVKIQRNPYCQKEKELSKEEYLRLVDTAKQQGKHQLEMILQTICGTGIRVSELTYITVEAVREGKVCICLKGKNRVILIAKKLKKRLKEYIKRQKLHMGSVFITKNGNPMNRSYIWKMMKGICKDAKVEPAKVFPHNLRHLFARCFYKVERDIAKLADLLGHSSVNTTRIYIISSGEEHCRQMDAMGLVR